jgi:hypothetical protein
LGDEAMIDENVIARRGATYLHIGVNAQEFNGGPHREQLERVARTS